ncbi:hypothetical protein MMC30_003167 [Trapelia coarctata]|nr:hypothetical protein [Trapelia coarctata]
MAAIIRSTAIMALLTSLATSVAAASGSGTTTRYWDCCKPSCAWNELDRLGISSPVKTCDINDKPLDSYNVQSGCAGGGAYMCSDQTPWEVTPDLAYGFAAVSTTKNACCQCYQLTFTSGPVAGKKMIVQATNTGGDVAGTQFDLAIPGGGMGANDGCSKSWGSTPVVWGAKFGGAPTNECASMPSRLQPGCNFRWGWLNGADNPTVDWKEVSCPAAITAKSGCVRKGDTPSDSSPVGIASAKVYAATGPAPADKPKYTPKPKVHHAQSSSTTEAAYIPANTPPPPVRAYPPTRAAETPAHTNHAQYHSTTHKVHAHHTRTYPPARKFTTATTFMTVPKKPSTTEEAGPAETGDDDECET